METAGVLKKSSGWAIAWSILLIALGVIAIAIPFVAAVAVTTLVAWLLIFRRDISFCDGVQHSRSGRGAVGSVGRAGLHIWRRLHAVPSAAGRGHAYAAAGAFFLVEGIFEIVAFFRIRGVSGSGWMLFDGLVTLLLAGLIWAHWPSSSAWAIGTIVGVEPADQRIQVADDLAGCTQGIACGERAGNGSLEELVIG